MAEKEILSAQRDMSAGELDEELKRSDDIAIHRAGARQMRDWRIRNARVTEQRPGRRALFEMRGRVDRVRMTSTLRYDLCFVSGGLEVRLADIAPGTLVGSVFGMLWTPATVEQIVWSVVRVSVDVTDVVICFPGQIPLIARWNLGLWTFQVFSFALDGSGIPLAPYYRVAAPGATMVISATGGVGAVVNVAFSQAVLLPAHVGAIFRFAGRRLRIQNYFSSTAGSAVCLEAMLPTQLLNLAAPDGALVIGTNGFALGQVVEGSESGAKGEVVGINLGTNQITVQLTNYASGFLASAVGPPLVNEVVVGPSARSKVTLVTTVGPAPAVSWDEQAMSDARGWPQSCSTDQQRLIFCDFPAVPELVVWSGTNQPYNLTPGAQITDPIVEPMAGKPRIYHVMPWTDEIVFTDAGIYYVPINTTNPLRPGSVSFPPVSPDAASSARPAFTSEGYLFVNAGRNRVVAVLGSGSSLSSTPYKLVDASEFHTHLFTASPKALAVATGDGQFPERYVYVTNADGSVTVGKYELGKNWIGWVPWSGNVNWVSTYGSDVMFVSAYGTGSICEVQDDEWFLDGGRFINVAIAALTPPAGRGPFWWAPNTTVQVMKDGWTPLGAHAVDHLGFVQPVYPGEDLADLSLVAGFPYVPTFEPFLPNAQPGENVGQRSGLRCAKNMVVTVTNCTGLVLASLYSGEEGPNLPVPGTIMQARRIPPWLNGDDPNTRPRKRSNTYAQRFSGRSADPRLAVLKDVPGPITLVEVAIESTV
jgi:hypothetical protein